MNNKFYKYLSVSEEDHAWGLFVTGAGHVKAEKNSDYPARDHPSHHYFKWAVGRKLNAYQILYITAGSGIFQSELTEIQKISPGDILFLFPGIWHRYQPDRCTGWNEYWVEFNGEILKHFIEKGFLNSSIPVITAGLKEEIIDDFVKIIDLIMEEKPGFQYITSGIIMHILGQIFAAKKYKPAVGQIETRINEAKIMILENLNKKISQAEVAKNVGLGYSLYRKKFREITGLSPASYQMALKINIAKHLLLSTNKPVKEIAFELGFESIDYFSRYFKMKNGITPSDFREGRGRHDHFSR